MDLVDTLDAPHTNAPHHAPDAGSSRTIWTGERDVDCVAFCRELRDVGIPYKVSQTEISRSVRMGVVWQYEIAIASSDYEKAKELLQLEDDPDGAAYGPAAAPIWRNKLDIAELITHGRRSRGGYSATTRVEITFKNNASFNISCLFISWDDLMQKFPGYPTSVKGETFPFMPPDASAPS